MGLRQSGSPITGVPTLKGVLEMVFDVLEGIPIFADNIIRAYIFAVLRYLRFDRQVLHRDISKGNILYLEEETRNPPDVGSGGANTGGKEVPFCFIKYLLKERYVVIAWDLG